MSQEGIIQFKTYAKNPAITTIFTADPSAHTWDGKKVYIYASHDMDPARGCDLMDRYHVFSSEDMINWVDEGEILRADDVSWGRPEGGFMWAPDCAYKNGTYYFYYPHPSETRWNDTWKIGVATSKHPAKGFKDQGYIPGIGGFAMIDPCVFVDDDGRAYIYYGGGGKCQGGELNDDMMSMKTEPVDMAGLVDFHEATWVFKRNGIYYLTYADNYPENNRMRYAVSDKPLGPWTYKGIFLEPTGCSTTHGSVMQFKGQWYLFYHNQEISDRGNLRSVCVDYLEFNEDGTIKPVVQTRVGGIRPTGNPPKTGPYLKKYEAKSCIAGGGAAVHLERGVVGGFAGAGSFCRFENVDGAKGGRASIYIHYATGQKLAKLNLTVNGEDFSLLNMPSTGGNSQFIGGAFFTAPLKAGASNTIELTGGNGDVFIDYIAVDPFDD